MARRSGRAWPPKWSSSRWPRLIFVKSRETLTAAKKWEQEDDDQENPASEDPPGEAAADDPNAAERETLRRELEEAKWRYEKEQFRAIAEMLRNEELVSSATLARGRDLSTEDSTHMRLSDLIVHIREVRRLYARPQETLHLAAEAAEAELHAWLLRRVGAQPADFKKLLR